MKSNMFVGEMILWSRSLYSLHLWNY